MPMPEAPCKLPEAADFSGRRVDAFPCVLPEPVRAVHVTALPYIA